jgi:hypothetical protein
MLSSQGKVAGDSNHQRTIVWWAQFSTQTNLNKNVSLLTCETEPNTSRFNSNSLQIKKLTGWRRGWSTTQITWLSSKPRHKTTLRTLLVMKTQWGTSSLARTRAIFQQSSRRWSLETSFWRTNWACRTILEKTLLTPNIRRGTSLLKGSKNRGGMSRALTKGLKTSEPLKTSSMWLSAASMRRSQEKPSTN